MIEVSEETTRSIIYQYPHLNTEDINVMFRFGEYLVRTDSKYNEHCFIPKDYQLIIPESLADELKVDRKIDFSVNGIVYSITV